MEKPTPWGTVFWRFLSWSQEGHGTWIRKLLCRPPLRDGPIATARRPTTHQGPQSSTEALLP